jgi:hypothetical protein
MQSIGETVLKSRRRVSARPNDGMSLPEPICSPPLRRDAAIPLLRRVDHDIVIQTI